MPNHQNVLTELQSLANPEKAEFLKRFFKTAKGQYAEGDMFLGLTVPQTRKIVKQHKNLPFEEIEKLLQNRLHEARLCALLLLVKRYENNPQEAYRLYLKNTDHINNWDLVDCSAEYIVGRYLFENRLPKKNQSLLVKLAASKSLWERRIAIISTFYFIKKGDPSPTLEIAELLLRDSHDLIHKAVGWMLREVGKRCSVEIEETFLKKYTPVMPRTMLRYAIERLPETKRKWYLAIERET